MQPEKAVQLTASLYQARKVARSTLGDRYADKMREYGAAIDTVARLKKIERLAAAILMAKQSTADGNGLTSLFVMAAAVELIEPSAETPA